MEPDNSDPRYPGLRRLRHFDYSSPTAYFITICVRGNGFPLGDVNNGRISLSETGQIVKRFCEDLPNHYSIALDAFVVMPNHFHAVLFLCEDAGHRPALPQIIRSFKSFSAKAINAVQGTTGQSFWQRTYFEHVIRNDEELRRIQDYVINNPQNWQINRENHDSTEGIFEAT